jgi:protein transport protein SEC31
MVRKLFEAKLMPAISAKNSAGALALHVELLTSATGDMSAWVPGVKQLIRLGV